MSSRSLRAAARSAKVDHDSEETEINIDQMDFIENVPKSTSATAKKSQRGRKKGKKESVEDAEDGADEFGHVLTVDAQENPASHDSSVLTGSLSKLVRLTRFRAQSYVIRVGVILITYSFFLISLARRIITRSHLQTRSGGSRQYARHLPCCSKIISRGIRSQYCDQSDAGCETDFLRPIMIEQRSISLSSFVYRVYRTIFSNNVPYHLFASQRNRRQ
jgi:hypothetical protein